MIGTKTEEMGSRKKLLAPVVVLLLCMVSLTGAAYAYSSTMTNTGNAVDADYISIDLQSGSASSIHPVANPAALVFEDHYSYANGADRQDRVTATVTTALAITYDLKVSSDLDYNKVKVSSDDIATLLARTIQPAVNPAPAVTVGNLLKIYVGTANDMSDAAELTAAGAVLSITKSAETTNFNVYVFIVAMDGATPQTDIGDHVTSTVRAQSSVGENDHNALYFRNLFSTSDYNYTITFEAYKA